jgi:hypothetical protein
MAACDRVGPDAATGIGADEMRWVCAGSPPRDYEERERFPSLVETRRGRDGAAAVWYSVASAAATKMRRSASRRPSSVIAD